MEVPTINMEDMVELPLDAGGMPIRVGDIVYYADREVAEELQVTALLCYGEKWLVRCERLPNLWNNWVPEKLTHVKPDTLEDIEKDINKLVETAGYYQISGKDYSDEVAPLMERIKRMVKE